MAKEKSRNTKRIMAFGLWLLLLFLHNRYLKIQPKEGFKVRPFDITSPKRMYYSARRYMRHKVIGIH